jgi:hypothetical protein
LEELSNRAKCPVFVAQNCSDNAGTRQVDPRAPELVTNGVVLRERAQSLSQSLQDLPPWPDDFG